MKITLIGLLVYLSIYALFSVTIKPYLTYRNWRYEIRNDVIQITNEYLNKVYMIIPIVKIEYVTTHQGPLLRHFNLTSITIRTVISTPALRKDEALQLCNDIALLAKLYDDQQKRK